MPGSASVPVHVTVACATSNALIRYTLDGTTPTESSTLYTGALHVDTATLIRARAFRANLVAQRRRGRPLHRSPACRRRPGSDAFGRHPCHPAGKRLPRPRAPRRRSDLLPHTVVGRVSSPAPRRGDQT